MVRNKQKSSCHFAWRNGSIAAWVFVHPTNTAVILDLKGFLINQKWFLSTSEYHYYYQGRKWDMSDFWNRHLIILSLKFIRSFEAATFSFTNLFSHLATLVCFLAIVPFVAFPVLLQKHQEKKSSEKISPLWTQCKTLRLTEDYMHKFHLEVNRSKLFKHWLAQFSQNPVDCVCRRSLFGKQANFSSVVFSKQFFHQKETLKSYKLTGICLIVLKFGQ